VLKWDLFVMEMNIASVEVGLGINQLMPKKDHAAFRNLKSCRH
jgi:hypothetical protein